VISLREMVEQPGCPNLYWALTDLPSPLVDLRKGIQGDRAIVAAELRRIRSDAPMTDAELEAFVSRIAGAVSFARQQAGLPPASPRAGVQARARNAEILKAARSRVAAAGCPEKLVAQFPPLQVILLDDKHAYEIERDEREKLLPLPLWQLDWSAGADRPKEGRERLFADLLPAITKLRQSRGQLEQEIALLRLVEALRAVAALHDGKLPADLSALSLPPPLDPFTGAPFHYVLDGTSAHLKNDPLPDDHGGPDFKVHYVVTIDK
jgi:hypothetical protein